MEKKEAIELLTQALAEIPHLRELHYDSDDSKLWIHKVKTITKSGLDSDDYATVWEARPSSFPMRGIASEDSFKKHYQRKLNRYEIALKSIIQKYEILGFEEKPAKAEPSKGRAESPNDLFDKMKLHPKIVEASESLFKDGHYAQAILEAFKAVNNFVKQTTGLSLDGKQLMAQVFNEEAPIIKLNKLKTKSDRDEQEGFKFLFMGAMVGIRNPKAHDTVIQKDPYKTLEYLGFASLLIKNIDFREAD